MKSVKVRKVGNSFGLTLPKELLEKYQLGEGAELHIIELKDGFTLTPFDPEFADWVDAFEKTNKKYKNTLKALSK